MTLPLPSSPHWPPTTITTMALARPLAGVRFGPAGLQVVEAGLFAAKPELDGAGGAVAVLGHDDLRDAGLLLRLVVLGPEDEHDDVRVLLDASTFAKVGEDRPSVRALLRGPAQLG